MTVTLTKSAGTDYVVSNKRAKVRTVTFTSTYPTGGETVTAATFGLTKLEQVLPHSSVATSTDLATSNPVAFRIASDGKSVVVLQYEGSAAGTALAEKTGAENYATGSNVRVTAIGY